MTDTILFDFNGVLVDDEELHYIAFARVLDQIRLPLEREQYYEHFLGLDDVHCFAEAFRLANRTLPTQLLRHLVKEKAGQYRELMGDKMPLVPGALEFVQAAAAEFRLGIVSGALREEITSTIERAGIAERFEVIVAAEDTKRGKPDPAGYRAALATLSAQAPVEARRCIAIEDSPPGVEAARAAGLRVVAMTTSRDASAFPDAAAIWPSFAGRGPADVRSLLDA